MDNHSESEVNSTLQTYFMMNRSLTDDRKDIMSTHAQMKMVKKVLHLLKNNTLSAVCPLTYDYLLLHYQRKLMVII